MTKYNKHPKGPLGGTNFLITIYNNQNSSWQGVLEWLDSGEKIHFRSALEMIQLMGQAVDESDDHPDHHRSWHRDGNTINII